MCHCSHTVSILPRMLLVQLWCYICLYINPKILVTDLDSDSGCHTKWMASEHFQMSCGTKTKRLTIVLSCLSHAGLSWSQIQTAIFFLDIKNGAIGTDSCNYTYQKQNQQFLLNFASGRQKKHNNYNEYLRAKSKASVFHCNHWQD